MNTTNSPWAPDASVFGALIPQALRPGEDYWNRAHPAEWAKVLAEFPLFAGVPKRKLRKLVTQAVPLEYVAGETVVWWAILATRSSSSSAAPRRHRGSPRRRR